MNRSQPSATARHPVQHILQSLLTVATLALSIAACQQQPAAQRPVDSDGLIALQRGGMDSVRIDPTVDMTAYRKLWIEGLQFTHVEILDPGRHDARYKPLTLSDSDRQQLNQLFVRQVTRQLLKDGRYDVTTQPGEQTLRVVTELVRLEPNAPRESDERFGSSPRSDTYTRGAGSLTLESQIYDSVSGKRVAVLRNELKDAEMWGVNNVVTTNAAVQRAFTRWASQLQRQLREASAR